MDRETESFVAFIVGCIIGAVISGFLVGNGIAEAWKTDLISKNLGEYTIDSKTGKSTFKIGPVEKK